MAETPMNVEQWVGLFRTIGLADEDMHRWHVEFERRYPQAHESFLRWLGLSGERVGEIRREAAEA